MTRVLKLSTVCLLALVACQKPSAQPQPAAGPTPRVKLCTTMGDITLQLDRQAAPATVDNFLRYVQEGFYDGTIFHRVIPDFMIQAGGHTADMTLKQTHPPIVNESANNLKNSRGSIAMARTDQPDSATSQLFINLVDNHRLDYAPARPGYAVFGRVIDGMKVADAIARVPTTTHGPHSNAPVEPVIIKSARIIGNR